MIKTRITTALAGLALLPMAALAMMSEQEATKAVQDALAAGTSADAIIVMLTDDGRSLADATALAVAVGGSSQADLARAGVCASVDSIEAEQVGNAIIPTADADLAETVSTLVETYETVGCSDPEDELEPPSSYAPSDTGQSGGSTLNPGSPSS
jgi:hypothetical protein